MAVRRAPLVVVVVAALVAACGSTADTSAPESAPVVSRSETFTITPSTTAVSTSAATSTTAPSSAATPVSPPPSVAPPPPIVVAPATSIGDRTNCQAPIAPPVEARNIQTISGDIDGNGLPDAVWLYDLADGPHLQVRTDRGRTDAIRLGFGQQAATLGLTQVDLVVGGAVPGTAQEILAAATVPDGSRLVGVFTFALKTGCLDEFLYSSGSPFVYLISRKGTYTGLKCIADNFASHLVSVSASPTSATTYATEQLIFYRNGKRLEPLMAVPGTYTLPADQGALAAVGNITGCQLSRPLF
jgi:hypothetical protein